MVAGIQTGTIVARATPQGTGAIGIVRLSGAEAGSILEALFDGAARAKHRPWRLIHGWLRTLDGQKLDEVLAVFMPGPRSFTGEDVVEIHCHGGLVAVESVTALAVAAGARNALAGEFARRAFENGRIDLWRAEGIARSIEAQSQAELRGAARLLSGEFGRQTLSLREELAEWIAAIEAWIEFPDEEDVHPVRLGGPLVQRLERMMALVRRRGERGSEVVVAGRTNVGKSSLVNALAGIEVSIVTPDPGTTRDAVGTWVDQDGEHFKLVDTAGEWSSDGKSLADREAARVTRQRVEGADVLIWVMDSEQDLDRSVPKNGAVLVMNKGDRLGPETREKIGARLEPMGGLLVSALTGQGVERLGTEIARRLRMRLGPSDGVVLDERQIEALREAQSLCRSAARRLEEGQPELAVVDLNAAYRELVWVTGESKDPGLLDRIFSRFCIGK